MNALADLEGALGRPLSKIGPSLQQGKMGVREVRALVWAGILHEYEDASLRQIGEWLNEAKFLKSEASRDGLMAKVFEALVAAFPEAATTGEEAKN